MALLKCKCDRSFPSLKSLARHKSWARRKKSASCLGLPTDGGSREAVPTAPVDGHRAWDVVNYINYIAQERGEA